MISSELVNMSTPQEIAQAVESAPYEASTATLLEKCVATQMSNGTYDFFANKALMKNYQNSSASTNSKMEVLTDVLTLALMRLPSTDYLSLSYLLPGKIADCPKLDLIKKYAELLEKAQYKQFWTEYSTSKESFAGAKGFESAIRGCVLSNLSMTFRAVDTATIGPMLGLEGASLKQFLSSTPLVESVTDSGVRFAANDENQPGGGAAGQVTSSAVDVMRKKLESVRGI